MDNIISNLYLSNGGNSEENDFTWLWISLIVTFAITFLICGCCLWYSIFHNNREETENSVTKPEIYANSSQPLINPRERFRKMFFQIFPILTILINEVFPKRDIFLQREILRVQSGGFLYVEKELFLFSVDILLKVGETVLLRFFTGSYVDLVVRSSHHFLSFSTKLATSSYRLQGHEGRSVQFKTCVEYRIYVTFTRG